ERRNPRVKSSRADRKAFLKLRDDHHGRKYEQYQCRNAVEDTSIKAHGKSNRCNEETDTRERQHNARRQSRRPPTMGNVPPRRRDLERMREDPAALAVAFPPKRMMRGLQMSV
ncbi:MAG TPA: hypothetical protein VNF99_19095, partial [Stellaceae bacterium]|nr:hypothetical protein [Stellaceae bacterium]